jgi:hypothetical protein
MPPPMPNQQQSTLPPSLQSGINSNNINDPNRPVPYRAGHDLNKQSTVANLKAAAAGIHGAGETLRGTFNDTFDRRNPTAHAKNQAVIDKGRSEIEAARARQYANQQQQPHMANQTTAPHEQHSHVPIIGAAPPPSSQPSTGPSAVPGKTAYQGPPVSGSQIEGGRSGGGGKLSNIMKKMKEGPTPR